MHQVSEVTVVLKAREGERLSELAPFLKPGCTVLVGRSGAVVSAVSCGDKITDCERLENQIVLAESAMRRGALMADQDHLPALRRVIDHVPVLYLQVADEIKRQAMADGDDEAAADEAAGQAIRVLVTFKQRLEKLLEPDLLTAIPVAVSEPVHIDERVKAVAAEPSFLTVVFKLPTLAAAQPLIAQLPYGHKALGTDAEVFGLTTGNLMEREPCEV